ncbi:hypothetical protein NDU88_008596 [Pleurodeles waltl]|uniref:Uncharacterized protein n=1 Tax=Pleurodeles waltl TaxID=8319 RepID=A0AAV7PS05_PLEWA|nr:hypothetical protein NDU88_008596 [Pleurodeles waltl]
MPGAPALRTGTRAPVGRGEVVRTAEERLPAARTPLCSNEKLLLKINHAVLMATAKLFTTTPITMNDETTRRLAPTPKRCLERYRSGRKRVVSSGEFNDVPGGVDSMAVDKVQEALCLLRKAGQLDMLREGVVGPARPPRCVSGGVAGAVLACSSSMWPDETGGKEEGWGEVQGQGGRRGFDGPREGLASTGGRFTNIPVASRTGLSR